jgi:predicted dinucleotide-binding enzyme
MTEIINHGLLMKQPRAALPGRNLGTSVLAQGASTMKIGVLGTGMVGETIGAKLVARGHEVTLGSRSATNEKAHAWAKAAGKGAAAGTFADAAAFGELVFLCTKGQATADVARGVADQLADKPVVDVTNPLDFSKGFPPSLAVCNTDSLGEQVQKAAPRARVVKALNTMNCQLMVDPASLKGDHNAFLSGNDTGAKAAVKRLLTEAFGWRAENLIDLGDLTAARSTEAMLLVWTRLYGVLGNVDFNFHIAR